MVITNIERREEILRLRNEGLSYGEICKQLNCDKSLVAYYCGENKYQKRKEELEQKEQDKFLYEQIVCDIIKESNNINQVCVKLGKEPTNTNYYTIKKIIKKYNIDISHFCISNSGKNYKKFDLDEILCENSKYTSTTHLRNRLIKENIKEEKCECCGNTMWIGKKIPLQLHHINGERTDNRIENLQLLCPNCHALTDNYCGSNIDYTKMTYNRKEVVKKEKVIPSKEEILKMVLKCETMKEIETGFGVKDNCVRKWCDKYKLPRKIKDLKIFAKNFVFEN